ncbi:MAG: hypothetical protein ACXWLH_05660 [Candidatus Saccharimonadales bacterium]
MYSGSTFHSLSGQLLGAHQKIDRVARRHLDKLIPGNPFPGMKAILHFEGNNGPDAIKRKSPAQDEPWHFLKPYDLKDTQLIELIEDHYKQLVDALKKRDDVRAAFEAAWLAHAVVDGLTPAHHFPYEEKLVELRCGRSNEDRNTIAKKLILPGESPSHLIGNNWKMWGPKGLFVTHAAFETGVAMLMAPLKLATALPKTESLADFRAQPVGEWFRIRAQEIACMDLYTKFYETGWTISLAHQVRTQLAPSIVEAVTLIWHGAMVEAGLAKQVAVKI